MLVSSFLSNSSIFSSDSLKGFTTETHRLDIILPDQQSFPIPIIENAVGNDVKSIIESNNITDYVICRNNPTNGFYDVLYASYEDPEISQFIPKNLNFGESLLQNIFVSNRLICTRQQRMALFVFYRKEFSSMVCIFNQKYLQNQYIKFNPKMDILVKMSTGLILSITIDPKVYKVKRVAHKIYKQMTKIYGLDVNSYKNYEFSTTDGYVPQSDVIFINDKKLKEILRIQKMNKNTTMFEYKLKYKESSFDRSAKQNIKDFDLVQCMFPPSEETREMNKSLSLLRRHVEKDRLEILRNNPLMARMRISNVYPPLNIDTNNSNNNVINLKVELRSAEIGAAATALSIRVSYDETADGAIKMIGDKLQKRTNNNRQETQGRDNNNFTRSRGLSILYKGNPNISFNPDDYVLVISGMDEVISGNTLLIHFVCVRQFILSGQSIMNLLLVEKKSIIESIENKEMNFRIDGNDSDAKITENVPVQREENIIKKERSKAYFDNMGYLSHNIANDFLPIFICGCFDVKHEKKYKKFMVRVCLIHGTRNLVDKQNTQVVYGNSSLLFNKLIIVPIKISAIPRAARISFTLYCIKKKKTIALATYNFPVFTFDGRLNSGQFIKKMWNNRDMDYILTTYESNEKDPVQIMFKFPIYKYPITFVNVEKDISNERSKSFIFGSKQNERIQILRNYDPLTEVSENDRILLWKSRDKLFQYPNLLPMVLDAANYADPDQVTDIPLLLKSWAPLSPTNALILLDSKYADQNVRQYAIERLKDFSDNEIRLYLLQLVQALKYELYDDSPLVHFIISRGVAEPKFLGHQIFWQLMSEAHLSHIRPRFSKILVNFIQGLGRYRDELLKGYQFTKQFVEINHEIEPMNSEEATQYLRKRLQSVEIPEEFHLPMDPRLIVKSFIIDKCKVMNSKKKPFWLTFENASQYATGPVQTMFKVGDDLRQDQLTLQVMSVMEHLWRENGIDLHMNCYGILPTGLNQGFIEVVPNSITEAALQQQNGTFSDEIYIKYITENASGKSLPTFIKNFRLSSAGYAVATCVLGIGDRHPGNIMIQKDGHFLHIDFGHFLGNFKTKFGYQRENAPFHFTPASLNVINCEENGFALFENNCIQALNILRKNAHLLITLLLLMLGTGIPELQKPEDILYMKEMLMIDKTDEEASIEFKKKINQSLTSTRTMLNNWFHNIKTG